jgi:DNA-binding transcriptional ArsR family regulator
VIEMIAERLWVIGEPMRIRLMEMLNEGSASRERLTAYLGTSPQNVSNHLRTLHRAGLVRKQRHGAGRVEFEMVDWAGWWLVERAAESLAELDGRYRPMGRSESTM